MKPLLSILTVALIGLFLPVTGTTLEIPLRYERFPDDAKLPFDNYSRSMISLPTGDWGLPVFNTKNPLYYFVTVGTSKKLLIFDTQDTGEFRGIYNRVYFDANGNRDFFDDAVTDGITNYSPDDGWYSVTYPALNTHIMVDDIILPFSFRIKVSTNNIWELKKNLFKSRDIRDYFTVSFALNSGFSGDVSLDDKTYKITFCDANWNGKYDDRLDVYFRKNFITNYDIIGYSGDWMFISQDEDLDYSNDWQPWGDMLMIGNNLFDTHISINDRKLNLIPITENLAPLQITMKTDRLTLFTKNKKRCLNLYRPGNEIRIPQNDYRLLGYQVCRNDEQGDEWRLKARGTGKTPMVRLNSQDSAVLTLGEPYRLDVYVLSYKLTSLKKDMRKGSFRLCISGKGFEQMTDISHIKGNATTIQKSTRKKDRPAEAAYKIVKKDGEIVSNGTFEYG